MTARRCWKASPPTLQSDRQKSAARRPPSGSATQSGGTAPNPSRAWGYTDMINEHIVLHPALCTGAQAVTNPLLPLWQRATGTLVLVHEAYHLRPWRWRRDEAKVQCEAIRQFIPAAQLLGAPPELANDLLPYALAAHARMTTP
jgi:hypothetical protein